MSIILEKRNQISRIGDYVNQLRRSRAVFEGCTSTSEGKKIVFIGINGPKFELTYIIPTFPGAPCTYICVKRICKCFALALHVVR